MRELTGTLWQRLPGQSLRCPPCGSPDVERCGHKDDTLLPAFGLVALPRQRIKCRACGASRQPLDEWLTELGAQRATWLVQELACLAADRWPYGDADGIGERRRLEGVSHAQIRRVASGEGALVAKELAAEAQRVLEAPVFDAGEEDTQELTVVRAGDGVTSRDHPNGREAKVGVVSSGVERIGKDRRRLVNRRDAATFKGSELLGTLGYAPASKLGGEKVGRLRRRGDGAKLARQRAELSRPIRQGLTDQVLVRLRELAEPRSSAGERAEVPKELQATITYRDGHRHSVVDDEAERAAGEHVGRGAGEGCAGGARMLTASSRYGSSTSTATGMPPG